MKLKLMCMMFVNFKEFEILELKQNDYLRLNKETIIISR